MNATARRLRERISKDRRRGGRGHAADVRVEVARHATEQRKRGRSLWHTSHELGVGLQTLQRWVEALNPRLRRIRVVGAERTTSMADDSSRPVVVLPSGVRIEGLGGDELVAFARALS